MPDRSVYATHCFRLGRASKAANSGVGVRIFQRHGRWSMEECFAKDGYVKDVILSRAWVNDSFNCPLFQALSLSSSCSVCYPVRWCSTESCKINLFSVV